MARFTEFDPDDRGRTPPPDARAKCGRKERASMEKTKETIKIVLQDGTVSKRTVYVDENGEKYVYNQRSFWKLEEFKKGRKII